MAKILICLLGFPLTSKEPLKLSSTVLNRLNQLNIKTVVGLETSKDRNLKDLIGLLKDEIEALSAISRAKELLPAEKFHSIFKLCKHAGNPMTPEQYDKSVLNLPVTRAMLELLSNIDKNKLPCLQLDIAQQELKDMTMKVDEAESLQEKILIQAGLEAKRMQAMANNIMKGINYLQSTGGVIWVADLRRHHAQRLAAYLSRELKDPSEVQIVSALLPPTTPDEHKLQALTENEFMKLDPPEIFERYKEQRVFDLIPQWNEETGEYACAKLDEIVENFIEANAHSENKVKVDSERLSPQAIDQSLKKDRVLDKILFDLNHLNFDATLFENEVDETINSVDKLKSFLSFADQNISQVAKKIHSKVTANSDISLVPTSLMSWTELKRWCQQAKIS